MAGWERSPERVVESSWPSWLLGCATQELESFQKHLFFFFPHSSELFWSFALFLSHLHLVLVSPPTSGSQEQGLPPNHIPAQAQVMS